MANSPVFSSTPNLGIAQVSAANGNRNGAGTLATILTAGASGSIITRVEVVAQGATTTGVVRLFIDDGSNVNLIEEILVDAITPGVSTEVFNATADIVSEERPLFLNATWILKASTEKSEDFTVMAVGGDF